MVVFRRNGVLVFRNGISVFRKQCFEMDGSVSKHGWQCFGVSGGVSRKCFEVDGSVSVFPESISKWMAVFRNGWQCFGVSGKSVSRIVKSGWQCGWQCFGVSKRYFQKWMAVFGVDGSVSVSVFRYFGVSVWCFGVSIFSCPWLIRIVGKLYVFFVSNA